MSNESERIRIAVQHRAIHASRVTSSIRRGSYLFKSISNPHHAHHIERGRIRDGAAILIINGPFANRRIVPDAYCMVIKGSAAPSWIPVLRDQEVGRRIAIESRVIDVGDIARCVGRCSSLNEDARACAWQRIDIEGGSNGHAAAILIENRPLARPGIIPDPNLVVIEASVAAPRIPVRCHKDQRIGIIIRGRIVNERIIARSIGARRRVDIEVRSTSTSKDGTHPAEKTAQSNK